MPDKEPAGFTVTAGFQREHTPVASFSFQPLFLAGLVALGPIYAWLYNFTGRVILAVIVLHAASNSASEVFAVAGAERLAVTVYAVLAILLVVSGRRWMCRERAPG